MTLPLIVRNQVLEWFLQVIVWSNAIELQCKKFGSFNSSSFTTLSIQNFVLPSVMKSVPSEDLHEKS